MLAEAGADGTFLTTLARPDPDEGLEDEDSKPGRPGFPVDPHRLVRATLRGKWWLLAAGVVGALAGYLIGKFVVKHNYESVASLQYLGPEGGDASDAQREMPTLLALAHSAPARRQIRESIGLPESVPLDAVGLIVLVTGDGQSGILSFHGNATDSELAAHYANLGVEGFLSYYASRQHEEIQAEIDNLSPRIDAAGVELDRAREVYDAFRRTNGITDLSTEQEQAIDRAAQLRADADLATAEIDTLRARIRTLQTQLGQTERTTTSTGGSSRESNRLRELEQQLREARAQGLGEEHPRVQALTAQVAAARRAVNAKGGGVTRTGTNPVWTRLNTELSTARTELEAATQRQASLEELANQAQARTTRFSAIEGQAATLLAAVNVKQQLVNNLSEQRSQLQDQLNDMQPRFRSVAEARPPESALPSKRKYIIAAGIPTIFLSVMLGMLLFRELRGLHVVTASEAAFWGNGPVIGTTTWPRETRALMDLIAGMDDYAPNATGTMLVVGSTEAEAEHAAEIAGQLNHDWSSQTLIDVPVLGALPSGDGSDPPPPSSSGYLDDEPISGEVLDAPTEIGISTGTDLALMGGPTEIEIQRVESDPPPAARIADPAERLVCTPWNGKPEGQALRRAARLADRVLVVVTSHGIGFRDLAQIKRKLGRDETVGFVLIGISDEVAKLDDRSGSVDAFWNAPPA